MPIELKEENDSKILVVHVTGKLVAEDYGNFVEEFERLLQQNGKLRLLFDMTGFHGWDVGAAWEDLKFELKHFADIERLAAVGDMKWQHGMVEFFSHSPWRPSATSITLTSRRLANGCPNRHRMKVLPWLRACSSSRSRRSHRERYLPQLNENQHANHGNEGPTGGGVRRHAGPYWKRAHHDWRFWVGLVLMLAAITIYVLSEDLAFLPRGRT